MRAAEAVRTSGVVAEELVVVAAVVAEPCRRVEVWLERGAVAAVVNEAPRSKHSDFAMLE